jgi:hypothetical protein
MQIDPGSISSWLIGGFALVYTSVQYSTARQEFSDEKARKLRASTLDDISRANPQLTNAWYILSGYSSANSDGVAHLVDVQQDEEHRQHVFDALDSLHFLAVGILQRNYDDETFALMMGGYFVEMITFSAIIEEIRQQPHRSHFYAAIMGACELLTEFDEKLRHRNTSHRELPRVTEGYMAKFEALCVQRRARGGS